jgi:excisionase family DNA binding protein
MILDINRPNWYTINETAKILRKSRITISRWISEKKIPFVRMDGGTRGRVLIPGAYFESLEAEALKAVL